MLWGTDGKGKVGAESNEERARGRTVLEGERIPRGSAGEGQQTAQHSHAWMGHGSCGTWL